MLSTFDRVIFERGRKGGLWIWNIVSKCLANSWLLVLSSVHHVWCHVLRAFRFSATNFRIWAEYAIFGGPDETLRVASYALSCIIVVNWVITQGRELSLVTLYSYWFHSLNSPRWSSKLLNLQVWSDDKLITFWTSICIRDTPFTMKKSVRAGCLQGSLG